MAKSAFIADDLYRMRFVGSPTLSPDGSQFLFTVTEVLEKENGYATSLWRYDGRESAPFTNRGAQAKVRDSSPVWSPDGRSVAFISNRSGSAQVWLIAADGGEAQQLTDLPLGVSGVVWSPDGGKLYIAAKEKTDQPQFREGATARRITRLRYKFNGVGYYDPYWVQLWEVDVASRAVRKLTDGNYHCSPPTVSPDGRYLAFISNRSDDERVTASDVWLLELATGALTNLTGSRGQAYSPVWTPDGRAIIYIGHEKGTYPGGYPQLREIDVETGERRDITGNFPHYIGNSIAADVRFDSGDGGPQIGDDGRSVYVLGVEGGNCYVYRIDRYTGSFERVFGDGQAVVTSFSIAGDRMAANLATPSTPGDLWTGRIGGEFRQVTRFNEALFADRYIGWPEAIHFRHPDGTQLEGWLIKPAGYEDGRRYPLIMEIHGGPHTTYGNAFFHEFQILAGHGFGVLYTNPRGSLGYGEPFARAVVGDWAGVDADDLQFMAEQAAKLPWVDAKRIGVTGGSQGGYFTNWLISHTDMFAAAVTQRSMSNLYSKYGVSDIGWSGDRAGMGGADLWDKEDFIMERSPIRYAPNVKTPLLILHSDEDYRCPLEQAEQWYVALKRLGKTVEMIIFHGENHELSRSGRPANRVVRLEAILGWFQKYLG